MMTRNKKKAGRGYTREAWRQHHERIVREANKKLSSEWEEKEQKQAKMVTKLQNILNQGTKRHSTTVQKATNKEGRDRQAEQQTKTEKFGNILEKTNQLRILYKRFLVVRLQ